MRELNETVQDRSGCDHDVIKLSVTVIQTLRLHPGPTQTVYVLGSASKRTDCAFSIEFFARALNQKRSISNRSLVTAQSRMSKPIAVTYVRQSAYLRRLFQNQGRRSQTLHECKAQTYPSATRSTSTCGYWSSRADHPASVHLAKTRVRWRTKVAVSKETDNLNPPPCTTQRNHVSKTDSFYI